MSRKYIDTSFQHFIKYKLNEIIKSEELDIEKHDEEESKEPQQESELKKDKLKKAPEIGSNEFYDEMIKEYEEIEKQLYDNIHRY